MFIDQQDLKSQASSSRCTVQRPFGLLHACVSILCVCVCVCIYSLPPLHDMHGAVVSAFVSFMPRVFFLFASSGNGSQPGMGMGMPPWLQQPGTNGGGASPRDGMQQGQGPPPDMQGAPRNMDAPSGGVENPPRDSVQPGQGPPTGMDAAPEDQQPPPASAGAGDTAAPNSDTGTGTQPE